MSCLWVSQAPHVSAAPASHLQLLLMRGLLRALACSALARGRVVLRLARALALLRLRLVLLPPLQVLHLPVQANGSVQPCACACALLPPPRASAAAPGPAPASPSQRLWSALRAR